MLIDVVKIIAPATVAFTIGILFTPLWTHILYTYQCWKKTPGKKAAFGGGETPLFNELHKEREVNTPRMGGVVIWMSVFLTICGFWLLSLIYPSVLTAKLDFLSRDQTWIPLFAFLVGAVIGLVDDWLEIKGTGNGAAGGLSIAQRLFVVSAVAVFAGTWLFYKLDIATIGIPFYGDLNVGIFIIPFFVVVALSLYAGGVIDGIDGLSGGVFTSIFLAYAGIAFYQDQINIAAFAACIAGGILAFLWFNIPPARFYMTETGTMALTMALAVIAFMTDSLGGGVGVAVLPIIAFPLLITVASNIIQTLSKKFRNGKKVFRIAPLHHHFEAIGWPSYKVTMRYWVLSIIFALIGFIIAISG